MMWIKLIVVLLAFIGTSNAIGVLSVGKQVRSAVTMINDVLTLVTGMDGLIGLIENDKSDELFQEKVIEKLDEIHALCTKIDDVKGRIDHLNEVMTENTDKLIGTIEFNNAKRIVGDFKKNVDYIDRIYFDKFTSVWNNIKYYKPGPVDTHIQGLVHDSVFDRALSEMLSDITSSPRSQSSIFSSMSKYYDTQIGYKFRCENISPLDDLHIFYGSVITTFARGYAVLLTSYQYLKMKTNDYRFYQDRQNNAFNNFKKNIETITQHAKIDFDLITDTNYRASYSCDPEWQEGRNFIRVKNYFSTQFSTMYWGESPRYPAPNNTIEYDCPTESAAFKGIPGAEYDTRSYLCERPFSPKLKNPYSVEYSELQNPLGRIWESKECIEEISSIYFNYCDADLNSDPFMSLRKLSTRLQECDTSKNEVVTDARFHEQDRKIHIKLQCGVLRDGKIDINTLRWTEDNEPFSEGNFREYVVLSSKLKSFNLDNVVVPKRELVTGAGFEVVDEHFISLVVKANKVYNYNHGNDFGRGKLYSAPRSEKPRTHIDLYNLERLPRDEEQTYEMSKPGRNYINLTLSAYSHKYHNSAIVPFFDMTPYKDHDRKPSPTPLSGLGLFYKSLPNYAGFLAFKHLSPLYIHFVDVNEAMHSALNKAQQFGK